MFRGWHVNILLQIRHKRLVLDLCCWRRRMRRGELFHWLLLSEYQAESETRFGRLGTWRDRPESFQEEKRK